MRKKMKSKAAVRRRVRDMTRKKERRDVCQQMAAYLKRRRQYVKPGDTNAVKDDDRLPSDPSLYLDDSIAFANCDGVGACCLDQPLAVEPGDLLRIVKNDAVRMSFGIEKTQDLFAEREDGRPLLVHFWDEASRVPACFAVPVLLSEANDSQTACPFYQQDGSACMLGDDRLTQCKSAPVFRMARLDGNRKIDGWIYRLNDVPCMGCPKDCGKDRRIMSVKEWMGLSGMDGGEGRFAETDLYVACCDWLRRMELSVEYNRMAAEFLFNWNVLIEENPGNAKELITSTRLFLEGIIREKVLDKHEGSPKDV